MSATTWRDVNMEVAGDLYDMALIHSSTHGRIAYKRAAVSILRLDRPVDDVVADGSLREVRFIGPASERIVLEHLQHGASTTVQRAVEKSGQTAAVDQAHAHRTNFLSFAGVQDVLRSDRPGTITPADYRGDLQMHSAWSDGSATVAELADAARARGYGFIGVSDHSYGLRIARGMSMEDAARQHREIDDLNHDTRGSFRVLKAIEANIPTEGGIDMSGDELATFELVLAAPHSRLRRLEDQTDRMIATVRHPGVHVLAHPRGRMYSRQGILARWDDVFAEAACTGVAIELDGDPYRQDLDFTLAQRARDAGCVFAIDSDAHSGP